MNDDELWAAVDAQRLRTTDLLEKLSPAEWDQPSLCEGWTVRDVAGHLTLQQMTLGSALRHALRHPGGVNHLIYASSRDRARRPTGQLIADIRGMVGSRRHVFGMTPFATLIDNVVHGQDIAVPTGRVLKVPTDVAATAASRVWDDQFSRAGRRKATVFRRLPYEGHRLIASDIEWSVGDGPEIRGPVLALLLLLTGRPVVIPQLEGEGVTALATRLGVREPRR